MCIRDSHCIVCMYCCCCVVNKFIHSFIGEILIALRAAPSKTIGVSPFLARFGYDFNILGLKSPFAQSKNLTSKDSEFLIGFNKHLETLRTAVKDNIMESKEVMAKEFNKSHRAAPPPYKEGTFVLLHTPLKANSPSVRNCRGRTKSWLRSSLPYS